MIGTECLLSMLMENKREDHLNLDIFPISRKWGQATIMTGLGLADSGGGHAA